MARNAFADDVFLGDGEVAALMRRMDWSKTSLGPVETWPEALKVSLRLLLTSKFEMWMGWGPEVAFLYNDAYRPTLGLKHPASLAAPTKELWAEIWEEIEPRIRSVYHRGEATWDRELQLILERNGYPEETYHTFSYSPIFGASGKVEGLFCAVTEDTNKVITARRLSTLTKLADRLASAMTRMEVLRTACIGLQSNPQDVPFAVAYTFNGSIAELGFAIGVEAGCPLAPERSLKDVAAPWRLTELCVLDASALPELPSGPWKVSPKQVAVVPLVGQGAAEPVGALAIGLNPHRPYDDDYRAFLGLVAGQIAASLASADVHEAERRRAAALAEAIRLKEEAAEALERANAKLLKDVTIASAERERFRLLVQGVHDYAIYMLDTEGMVASWNTGAQKIKGYSEDEIVGQHFSCFYTEQDRASGMPERALRIAREQGSFEHEGWRVRKDGSLMWAHVVMDPIRDENGELIGYAKVTRDLSEHKADQEALRRSEERFRLLVQGVKDYAIYMLDPQGHVANWNSGAQQFKGYTEAEIIGQHFARFYTDEDREAELPARNLKIAADEGRFEEEGWRVRKDGSRFWAHVVIDAIRGANGELLGFAKITRDVTEKREAHIALEEARARVVQAQKMEAVGQLTGGIAHDFNNLLAVVLGNLGMAKKRLPPDQKLRLLIDNSVQAAERGATLTKRMLAFARRQQLEASSIDVLGLVRDMSDLLQRSIGPAIPITMQFPLRLAPALADPNQLELALLNLCVNARDAMPDGGTIVVSASEREVLHGDAQGLAPGHYICLAVADTGVGMDEKTLAQATEPFFTTKGVGKGTGLGLPMVHGFAQQSGGALILRSAKGQGTRAEIWLPVGEAVATARPAEATPESPSLAERALRVLVVDDDNLVLMNTTAMLEDLGHVALEAASGEQALRQLRRSPDVDLVITDHLMPGMKGTQLVEAIRSEWPDLPVIIATGYAELEGDAAPSIPRLAKPFTQIDLARSMAAQMQRNAARVLPFRQK